MTIEQNGELEFENADDSNIPVSIFVREIDAQEDGDGKFYWEVTADNYMPRRGRCADGAFNAKAETREEIAELLRVNVLPLYETALAKLNKIIEGKAENLYYWSNDE